MSGFVRVPVYVPFLFPVRLFPIPIMFPVRFLLPVSFLVCFRFRFRFRFHLIPIPGSDSDSGTVSVSGSNPVFCLRCFPRLRSPSGSNSASVHFAASRSEPGSDSGSKLGAFPVLSPRSVESSFAFPFPFIFPPPVPPPKFQFGFQFPICFLIPLSTLNRTYHHRHHLAQTPPSLPPDGAAWLQPRHGAVSSRSAWRPGFWGAIRLAGAVIYAVAMLGYR